MYDDLVEFLQESVTPFHAAATAESWLCAAGFTRLEEADYWNLEPGKGYYTTRNGSSVVAWRAPATATPRRGKSRPTPLKTTAAAA